jgi:mono/diheme cytochrome c family protein
MRPPAFLLTLVSLVAGNAPLLAQEAAEPPKPDSAYFDAYHPAPRDTVSEQVYQGWKQFALNCARCHGDFGVGTSFAPALVESVKPGGTIPTQELFIQTVCAGRPEKGMPAWCAAGLEIGVIQTIYAYLGERAGGRVGLGRPAVRAP